MLVELLGILSALDRFALREDIVDSLLDLNHSLLNSLDDLFATHYGVPLCQSLG